MAEIEEEQGWVDANKALIQPFEAKIKAAIRRVWSEEKASIPLSTDTFEENSLTPDNAEMLSYA